MPFVEVIYTSQSGATETGPGQRKKSPRDLPDCRVGVVSTHQQPLVGFVVMSPLLVRGGGETCTNSSTRSTYIDGGRRLWTRVSALRNSYDTASRVRYAHSLRWLITAAPGQGTLPLVYAVLAMLTDLLGCLMEERFVCPLQRFGLRTSIIQRVKRSALSPWIGIYAAGGNQSEYRYIQDGPLRMGWPSCHP